MSIAFVAAKHFARRLYKKLITLRTGACAAGLARVGQVGVKVGGWGTGGGKAPLQLLSLLLLSLRMFRLFQAMGQMGYVPINANNNINRKY